jgi:hypothetical protein
MIAFHSSSLVSDIGFCRTIPALLIKMLIVPKAASVFATRFLADSVLEISHWINRAFSPTASATTLPDSLISLKIKS